jgi:steroid 5-alpha reductase family enzyme
LNFETFWQPLLVGWGICGGAMLVLWAWATMKRDASVVDVAWAALLGVLAVFFAVNTEGNVDRRWLIGIIGGVWSARLAGYLLVDRLLKAAHEDGRYQELRASWGASANWKFFLFFQAQGLLDVILSVPFLLAVMNPGPIGVADIAGGSLWLVGIIGETIADKQLASWRQKPENRGRTCRAGLWRYSRHPNYFFEWLMWCSYALIATGSGGWGWAAWYAPLVMLFLIMKVTGIPPTEARALKSRGDDYREYQRTTSAFFPWRPARA